MNARTGLAAETCTRELAQAMAAIPVLAEAFSKSSLTFRRIGQPWPGQCESPFYLEDRYWSLMERVCLSETGGESISAPTVPEMLDFLSRVYDTLKFQHDNGGWRILLSHTHIRENGSDERIEKHLPDALARACIEVTS